MSAPDKRAPITWLQRAGAGLEHGEALTVTYEGKHHALVRFPGYMSWFRIGERKYAPTEHIVIQKGTSIMKSLKTVQGRLSKAQKADLINFVDLLDKTMEES